MREAISHLAAWWSVPGLADWTWQKASLPSSCGGQDVSICMPRAAALHWLPCADHAFNVMLMVVGEDQEKDGSPLCHSLSSFSPLAAGRIGAIFATCWMSVIPYP